MDVDVDAVQNVRILFRSGTVGDFKVCRRTSIKPVSSREDIPQRSCRLANCTVGMPTHSPRSSPSFKLQATSISFKFKCSSRNVMWCEASSTDRCSVSDNMQCPLTSRGNLHFCMHRGWSGVRAFGGWARFPSLATAPSHMGAGRMKHHGITRRFDDDRCRAGFWWFDGLIHDIRGEVCHG